MSVSSFNFLVFVLFTAILFHGPLRRFRWQLLLCASIVFYALWGIGYLVILIIVAAINHFLAIKIYAQETKPLRRPWFYSGLIFNILFLVLFKYIEAINHSISQVFSLIPSPGFIAISRLVIPLGISYYSFKNISHLIDNYRHTGQPAESLGKYLTYVAFFPAITSGPIDRSRLFLPQLDSFRLTREDVDHAVTLIVWGFFKKIMIADSLAVIVGKIYGQAESYSGIPLWIGTWAFAYQLYCDFSGYTDIARGTALLFGIRLDENFDRPYASKTVTEFWQRWHKTLSFWLRDYIFLPLAYLVSRRIKSDRLLGVTNEMWSYGSAIVITWLIGGFWHGDSWSMICWGLLQGIYLLMDRAVMKRRKKLLKAAKKKPLTMSLFNGASIFLTFNLISFSWIFFRSGNFGRAWYVVTHLFSNLSLNNLNIGMRRPRIIQVFMLIIAMEIIQKLATFPGFQRFFSRTWVRISALFLLAIVILLFGEFGDSVFVYSQF